MQQNYDLCREILALYFLLVLQVIRWLKASKCIEQGLPGNTCIKNLQIIQITPKFNIVVFWIACVGFPSSHLCGAMVSLFYWLYRDREVVTYLQIQVVLYKRKPGNHHQLHGLLHRPSLKPGLDWIFIFSDVHSISYLKHYSYNVFLLEWTFNC